LRQGRWQGSSCPLGYVIRGDQLVESGKVSSLKEIAKREGIDSSYISRMINLTTLAPELVEAILDDDVPDHVTLFDLAVDTAVFWNEQRQRFEFLN